MTEFPAAFDPARFHAALTTAALGRDIRCFGTIPSTMDAAREAADAGAPHGTVLLAEAQSAGRGRRGRGFHSPSEANLYVTFVLRPLPGSTASLPVAVPLAVCEAIRATGADVRIKWPNDIWVGGRKLSGMLIDAATDHAGLVGFVGIGINVNGDPRTGEGLSGVATSLALELGHQVSREHLLAAICNRLEPALRESPAALVAAYAPLSLLLGQPVLVHEAGGETYAADALRIAPDGALVVRRADGVESEVHAAEVSVRPASHAQPASA